MLLVFLAAGAGAVAATPTRGEALAAIATLETNLLSDDGLKAAGTIAQFAQESEEVFFMLGPDTAPWITEERPPDEGEDAVRSMLLAVYFAGNAKAQLRAGKAEDDPYSGWIAVLRAYRQFQTKRPLSIPSLEEFSAMEAEGTLQAYAREVQAQQKELSPPPKPVPSKRDASF